MKRVNIRKPAQGADETLLGETVPASLPPDVEARLLSALPEAAHWAGYLTLDAAHKSLLGARQRLGVGGQAGVWKDAQALVVTPMPCGGTASYDVCAVRVHHGRKVVCEDGPVFQLSELGDLD
ncbi:MAG: hypothetical protein ACOYYU_01250 [Chloroflexota bacterium]